MINKLLPSLTLLAIAAAGCSKPVASPKLQVKPAQPPITATMAEKPEGSGWEQYHVSNAAFRAKIVKATLPSNAGEITRECLAKALQINHKTNDLPGYVNTNSYECGVSESPSHTLRVVFHGNKHVNAPSDLYLDYDWKAKTFYLSAQKVKPDALFTDAERAAKWKFEGESRMPAGSIDNRLSKPSLENMQKEKGSQPLGSVAKALAAQGISPLVQIRYGQVRN